MNLLFGLFYYLLLKTSLIGILTVIWILKIAIPMFFSNTYLSLLHSHFDSDRQYSIKFIVSLNFMLEQIAAIKFNFVTAKSIW